MKRATASRLDQPGIAIPPPASVGLDNTVLRVDDSPEDVDLTLHALLVGKTGQPFLRGARWRRAFQKMVKLLGLYWLVINRPPVTNGCSQTAKQGQ